MFFVFFSHHGHAVILFVVTPVIYEEQHCANCENAAASTQRGQSDC